MSAMKKWIVGSLTAMVVGAGSLVSLAGPAQAYGNGTCDWRFGAGNVAEVDLVRVETGIAGKVDFGDLPHTGVGGPPGKVQGTAVVCWATDGQVAVLGRVFADSGDTITVATAQITFYDNDGVALPSSSRTVVGNHAESLDLNHGAGGGNFTRARIRLYSRAWGTKLPLADTLVHTSNYYRG